MENKIDLQSMADELEFELEDMVMLIDVFLESSKMELEKLNAALEKNDLDLIYRSAHAIKGSAANLLLKDIAKQAKEIELKAGGKEDYDYKGNVKQLEHMINNIR